MTELLQQQDLSEPQCQFFVVRKKRLCRMTVKPGRQYCGEHEPLPKTADGQDDSRVPCPNDPKHTCYVSKLKKHLLICNARPVQQPPYIVHNINCPTETDVYERKPLSQLSKETILAVIDKVNALYDKHINGQIVTEPEHPIHSAVLEEFSEGDRAESSLRHLRQVSSLLWLVEREGLVGDHTCYVELGAGKGHVSYYACNAWCAGEEGSSALLVDRASLRHKRDNKLRTRTAQRLRADLAHLALGHVPAASACRALVGLAKHLCGVATDYALRCMTSESAVRKARGLVLATCCHHRCQQQAYVANEHLQKLGISGDDLNVMLGIVSWATCGDGRSRQYREKSNLPKDPNQAIDISESNNGEEHSRDETNEEDQAGGHDRLVLGQEYREKVGRRAKQLLDWGRVLYLRDCGFDARLCYFVPTTVSPENVCIVAKKCR
ncbi:unnamed protein product [Arctia plantaginis]|uniref:tRNA:m(4)X modification enzyme TRM13 n=1 Tax=Arctia plantaginis TaxID=874455 RepID=A0A8S1ADG0_ARCPL|nr:unnamed protein product [Arctia plantaginis]